MITVGIPFVMSAEFGSCQVYRISDGSQVLFPGDTMLLEIPKNAALFSVEGENVNAYFYDDKPISVLISKNGSYNDTLLGYAKLAWGFHLNEGSAVKITWNSEDNESVTFRLIKGYYGYDFFFRNNMVLAEYLEHSEIAVNGSYEFNASVASDYYYTIENNGVANTVKFLFEMNEYEYKTDEGVLGTGSGSQIDLDPTYEYVVLKYSDSAVKGKEVSYYFEANNQIDYPDDDDTPADDPFDEFPFGEFPFGGFPLILLIVGPLMGLGIIIFMIAMVARNNSRRQAMQRNNHPNTTSPFYYDSNIGKPAYLPVDNQAAQNPQASPAAYSNQGKPVQPQDGFNQQQTQPAPGKIAIEVCPFCGSSLDLATKNAYLAGNGICSYCKSRLN